MLLSLELSWPGLSVRNFGSVSVCRCNVPESLNSLLVQSELDDDSINSCRLSIIGPAGKARYFTPANVVRQLS